ncbi:fumarylacetoacetate hydrolase family protein [Mycobacterium sp. CVI_P3]|uniref:Fumarylacetoacetate hydrolase family protein n=1 Tax=Mycobacterium pinniadriaticum TaxID=2994102 RepID=A0ABT3SFG2_9MYCO|nr:fumarylacetoacetate hydrolase family protein [Mycobacterium pinniadriaticum]MCX2931798.1 fumarylacetoacetate hydrolase family protein [Mycobacterium pinniadriaticum]MCX2938127.1 fumarylacetoacetate hydrolase family protein [Mycobacterium pinniadriaticum]
MRLAVVSLARSEDTMLVEVLEDVVFPILDAGPSQLVEVARAPHAWPDRGPQIFMSDVRFRAPLERPPSIRDFMVYEAHLVNSLSAWGQRPPESWYREPVFYFSNPAAVIGDGDVVRRPSLCKKLDYEVELAAVIGCEVSDLDASDPNVMDCVSGFTLMNDWSARDLAAEEMKHHLGPAKGKDFSTSLGPWLVTTDEFSGELSNGIVSERVTARVNGEIYTDNSFADMTFPWPAILQRASANTTLLPGDVIGSGTVGFGCLLELRIKNKELGFEKYRFLEDGDVVEIEAPRFGVLRNIVQA